MQAAMPTPDANDDLAARRRRARRTAGIVALIAAGIYVAFILSGVIGR
ncbi:hypothetical protein LDO26_17565 [Luteimonas sp. BDR2-5]|nr:hypothetical protein [Luteimonas sp. BDR2-5]MCD9030001.1 hypothetical protein [Luteimonas sp. BDR2-5]